MKKLAPIVVVTAGALWGLLGLFARHLTDAGLGAFEVALIRMGVACLTAGAYLLLFQRRMLRIRRRDLWCFAGAGLISMLLFSFFYLTGIQYTSLAVGTVLVYTAPIFVMLMSVFFFREKLTLRKLAALFTAFIGCILVSGLLSETIVVGKGFFLCLAAGFFYSLYSIFGKLALDKGYAPLTTTFYSFLFCTLGCACLADWRCVVDVVRGDAGILPWMIGTGVVSAFLPYTLYSIGLKYMEPSKASILASIELAVEAAVGVLIYRERLTAAVGIGMLLIFSAIVVLNVPAIRLRRNAVCKPDQAGDDAAR